MLLTYFYLYILVFDNWTMLLSYSLTAAGCQEWRSGFQLRTTLYSDNECQEPYTGNVFSQVSVHWCFTYLLYLFWLKLVFHCWMQVLINCTNNKKLFGKVREWEHLIGTATWFWKMSRKFGLRYPFLSDLLFQYLLDSQSCFLIHIFHL